MGTLTSMAQEFGPTVAGMMGGNPLVQKAVGFAVDEFAESESYKRREKQNALNMQQAQKDAATKTANIEMQAQLAEEERLRNLKSAIAKQRASFGASGVSSTGGSSQAVLEGFMNESEEEKQARKQVDNMKKQAIQDSLKQTKQKNILEVSQMEEENSIFNLFG